MSAAPSLNLRAALASIAVALLLLGMKVYAVWSTRSTAMLGSLADTALDLVASLATLTGVWIAAMPADEDHRFGHGKAEALAAMLQGMLISISAFGLALRAVQQWLAGGRGCGRRCSWTRGRRQVTWRCLGRRRCSSPWGRWRLSEAARGPPPR